MIAPEKLLEAAKALEPQLQEWRRTLHRHPEVGFDLPQTKALVKKALTEMGYTPQDCGQVRRGGACRRQAPRQGDPAAGRHGRSAPAGGIRRGIFL